jgi:hypothetical protein
MTETEPLHPNTDTNLCIFQRLALLQVLVLFDERREVGVGVELVGIRGRVARFLQRHNLLAADLKVLLPTLAMTNVYSCNWHQHSGSAPPVHRPSSPSSGGRAETLPSQPSWPPSRAASGGASLQRISAPLEHKSTTVCVHSDLEIISPVTGSL